MHARHPLLARFLILTHVALATMLSACGGYGGNYNAMGAAPGATCGGTYSVACPPPTVSLTAPAANATVSGMVTFTADATASSTYSLTIMRVAFLVDGTSVGTAMSSPYTFVWDSTKVANGNHTLTAMATDSASDTMTSAAVTVSVQNAGAAAASLGPEQMFPMTSSKASGTAQVHVVVESGALSGAVVLSGTRASSVTLNEGFAGTSGQTLLTLTPRAGRTDAFDVPAAAVLTPQQVAAFGQGRLYVVATSAAYPEGEIRGQLTPEGIRVVFTPLAPTPEAAQTLDPDASAVAATTVDTAKRTLTVHVSSVGLEVTTAAVVTSGPVKLASLARDAADPAHWSSELAPISAADLEAFVAGRWTASVAASTALQGAMRGQIEPADATRSD